MLRQRRTGRGLVVGLCVLCVAILLDRVCRSFVERRQRGTATRADRRVWLALAVGGLALIVLGRVANWSAFPIDVGVKWADSVDTAVRWVRDTFHDQAQWLNDTFIREVYVPLTDWVGTTIRWPVWLALAFMLGYAIRGLRLGVFCAVGVFMMGFTGLWLPSSETFVEVMISAVIAAAIAVPLGIWAGRHTRLEPLLAPVLDAFQTVPAVTYIIAFVMIFDIGVVPGIIATVIYALAPGVRVTALGIKDVPATTVEAATTFGASNRQLLWDVRIPLALSAIMLAINQVICMSIAMVIIVGLNGGGALGYKIVESFQRQFIGQGIEVALALALMAMVLDRLTQGLAQRFQPPAARA